MSIWNKNMPIYILGFGLIMVVSFYGNKFRQTFITEEEKDEYVLVQKYLLNDCVLYGKNRPKIWIHTTYDVNARKWKNFMSRNSTDLNQPYLYLTVQSIVNHCGKDFNICLIDDESFEKLIPTWSITLSQVPEPARSRYRQMAMVQLLKIYGGMIVPNSFLCLRSLKEMYEQGVSRNTPFLLEKRKQSANIKNRKPFEPDLKMMGSLKDDPFLDTMLTAMLRIENKGHFSQEMEFDGSIENWCLSQSYDQTIQLLDGKTIGVKTKNGKPILVDDWMGENFLELDTVLFGILIPKDELLSRIKFQWFTILPYDEIMKTTTILSKYFKMSTVERVHKDQLSISVL
jgi:hypothetical protein